MAFETMLQGTKVINKVVMIPLERIVSNPNQPRKGFDRQTLLELARSIENSGLLQPVTVRKRDQGMYELISGERRMMAFRLLERGAIPAIVEEMSDRESAVLALIENLQRRDLNYFEESNAIRRLMCELGLTQQQISEKLGKAQSTVANKLRLLRIPDALQDSMLAAGLTERHARAILRVEKQETMEKAVEHVIRNGLNVRQTEQYLERLLCDDTPFIQSRIIIIKDMRIFFNSIQKAVDTMRSAGVQILTDKGEDGDNIVMTLKIPKTAVCREKTVLSKKAAL